MDKYNSLKGHKMKKWTILLYMCFTCFSFAQQAQPELKSYAPIDSANASLPRATEDPALQPELPGSPENPVQKIEGDFQKDVRKKTRSFDKKAADVARAYDKKISDEDAVYDGKEKPKLKNNIHKDCLCRDKCFQYCKFRQKAVKDCDIRGPTMISFRIICYCRELNKGEVLPQFNASRKECLIKPARAT
jgi:hypothetical protein